MPAQTKKFTFTFDPATIKGISDALVQAPYYIAQPIIDDMNRQIAEQQQATPQILRTVMNTDPVPPLPEV